MRVMVRGVVYETVAECAKALKVSRNAVKGAIARGREDFIGTGTGNKVPVIIRGVTYPSQIAAAKALGVRPDTVANALARGRLDTVGNGKGRAPRGPSQWGGRPAQPVTLAGIDFPSMSEASRKLGFCDRYVQNVLTNGTERQRETLQRAAEAYRDRLLAELLDRQAARDRAIRQQRLECNQRTGREAL